MKDVILLHGALGAQVQFDDLRKRLEPEYKCHSLDLPGHGSSSFAKQFGIEAFSRELENFIEQYQLKNPLIFGYSMGGYVALFLESTKPNTFSKIFTLGTKFQWTPEIAEKESGFLDPEKIREKVPDYAKRLEELHGDKWPQLCEETAKMMRYLGTMNLLNAESYGSIQIPVRVGIGDKDKMVTLEETTGVFRKLKKGSFLVMPSTPHPIEQVSPERLAYKLRKFFES